MNTVQNGILLPVPRLARYLMFSLKPNTQANEALLNRMIGVDDGIVDALFTFTRPVTGSYLWCPPMKEGKLDLSAIYHTIETVQAFWDERKMR